MISGFGPTELIIVLVIVLLIFGPKRLPGLGKSLGSGMREFKDSITGKDDDKERDGEDEQPPALERPAAEPAAPAATTAVRADAEVDRERERTPHS